MNDIDDLKATAENLRGISSRLGDPDFSESLTRVRSVAQKFGKASSGSWLGYHARVYYSDFAPPKPGDNFSQEWGLMHSTSGQKGWREFSSDDVIDAILLEAGRPDLVELMKSTADAQEAFEQAHGLVLSRLTHACSKRKDDKFLEELLEKTRRVKLLDADELVQMWAPKGPFMSRDMVALNDSLHQPPHLAIAGKVGAIELPYLACKELGKLALQAAKHLEYEMKDAVRVERIGSRVFIGHGRAGQWKDLKDFVQDRLHLPWDEFNRLPVAGVTNIARLAQMMDGAAIALLVMTGEDEQVDGQLRARENVVHEAGLFQGRLGFERAIVLLEEGCQEFSNINGLGQIRFPKGNIKAVFEEIRQVLEREGLVEPVP